jgi:hypothetical protein
MRRIMSIRLSLAIIVCAAMSGSVVRANHSWGGYRWASPGTSITLDVGDNVSSVWDPYLSGGTVSNETERGAILDWNSPTMFGWNGARVIDLRRVAGGANPKNCRPTSGRIEVCNSKYGNNGWLGIAQIWISGGLIVQATTKLNDTYFNTSTYNKPAWRRLVTCQEVAHDFGLAHQDENFDNANVGSCMDYTSDPAGTLEGQLSNERPNKHDFEELSIIYSEITGSSAAGASAGQDTADSPSEWGRLVHSNGNGRVQVFERELGGNRKIVTEVFWADPEHDARPER